MSANTNASSKAVGNMAFLLRVSRRNSHLTVLVEMARRVEMVGVGTENIGVSVHVPDIDDDDGARRDEVALIPIILRQRQLRIEHIERRKRTHLG